MRSIIGAIAGYVLLSLLPASANAQTVGVNVPGTASPWLAGMPDGTPGVPIPPPFSGSDSAPGQSPALAIGLILGVDRYLTFATSGQAGHAGGVETDAEGRLAFMISTGQDFESPNPVIFQEWNGISGARAPLNALMGVFLDDSVPNLSPAPPFLNFENNRNYLTLSPLLKQAFFVGNGMTDANVLQKVHVPIGATRLYLGIMDGFGWHDNTGAFQVQVTSVVAQAAAPEPASVALLLPGGFLIWQMRRFVSYRKPRTVG
jgi:hypothetical protein